MQWCNMLFHLKWHQNPPTSEKKRRCSLVHEVHSPPDRYETGSKVSIYLRMEGNVIFQVWDSVK